MSWYKVEISEIQGRNLANEFMNILLSISKHKRKDMYIFSGGFSHDDYYNLYFSPFCASHPAMKGLIDSCGAVPCDEPTRETESSLHKIDGSDSGRWRDFFWHPDLELTPKNHNNQSPEKNQ